MAFVLALLRVVRGVLLVLLLAIYVILAMAMLVGFYVLVGAAIFAMLGWNYPVVLAVVLVTVGVVACNVAVLVQDWIEVRASRMTVEQVIRGGSAQLVNHDDFGKLWSLGAQGGEPLLVVELVNMTPNRDGSYSRHFLRVPPGVRSAREAVAWTFGFESADEYALAVES